MKHLHLLAIGAAMAALPVLAATDAAAQQRQAPGPRITLPPPTFHPRLADGALRSAPPSHANHFSWEGHRGFHGGVFIVLRQAQDDRVVEREVVREVAVTPPPTPPHQGEGRKRKPYVIGGTYASLPPQGCMKLIEDGASYYFCGGGEWYRPLGDGRGVKYRAVAKP